jgi:hypothetical protein
MPHTVCIFEKGVVVRAFEELLLGFTLRRFVVEGISVTKGVLVWARNRDPMTSPYLI